MGLLGKIGTIMNKTYSKKEFLNKEDEHSEYYAARVTKEGYCCVVISDGKDKFILDGYLDTEEKAREFSVKLSTLTSGLVELQEFICKNYIEDNSNSTEGL